MLDGNGPKPYPTLVQATEHGEPILLVRKAKNNQIETVPLLRYRWIGVKPMVTHMKKLRKERGVGRPPQ